MTDGWVLVPREPTEAMLDAMFSAYVGSEGSYSATYRAALAAAPPVDGWQAIETAPRDGTAVVGWGFLNSRNDNGPLRSAVMVAHVMRYRNYASGGGDWVSACLSNVISQHPTHWMPLPPPPSADSLGGYVAKRSEPDALPGDLRETVARIVDPLSWRRFDRRPPYAAHIPRETQIEWVGDLQPSLDKADAILSLIQSERGGG